MSKLQLLSLFTGYGGLDTAVNNVFGSETAYVSDVSSGACKVLAHRMPDIPNLGDITKINWSTLKPVDIICGGSPCQDMSTGGKRAGMLEGTRSGLWSYMLEGISVVRPKLVIWENVRGALSAKAYSEMDETTGHVGDNLRAIGRVLGDLASLGYDAEWAVVRASAAGCCHRRERVFILAWDAHSISDQREWASGFQESGVSPETWLSGCSSS